MLSMMNNSWYISGLEHMGPLQNTIDRLSAPFQPRDHSELGGNYLVIRCLVRHRWRRRTIQSFQGLDQVRPLTQSYTACFFIFFILW